MPLPDLITFTPDPPQKGKPFTVCCQFRSGDPSPRGFLVEWTLTSGSSSLSVELSAENKCETITCPADGVAVIISDPAGISAPAGGACV